MAQKMHNVLNDDTVFTDFVASLETLFKENTDAITQIDMVAGGGNDFVANSTFDLYGILGA